MTTYEMPVVIRLNQQELAHAIGRPVDDPDVQRLGGLTLVLRPIGDANQVAAHPSSVSATGASSTLQSLQQLLKPIEEKLFQRLRSNPAIARRFLINPTATLCELGLVDAATREEIESHAAKLSPAMAGGQ